MEEKEKIEEKDEKGSNSCVMDLSLEGGGEEKDNLEENIILNKSFDDIKNFSSKLTLKDNYENIFDDIFFNDEELKEKSSRSKTIAYIKHKWNILVT